MPIIIGDGTSNTTISSTYIKVPKGNTASRPSNPTIGTLYYNTEKDGLENYTAQGWLKVSVKTPSVTSISGSIYSGNISTLSLSGSGFGAGSATINFVSGAVNANVTTTSLTDISATVLVPASIYGLGSGNTVNITLTNSDGVASGVTQKTSIGLPTGGTITTANGFYIHTFTSSNTFVVPTGFSANANYLVVAGGGSGGGSTGGGGGAGGLLSGYINITSQSYTITIGGGGPGTSQMTIGVNGTQTTAFGLTAVGGGGGAYTINSSGGSGGLSGGSGGGGTAYVAGFTSSGSGTSGQGNAGGV